MTRWLVALLLVLGVGVAQADTLEFLRDGNEAYRAGELEQALDAFTRAVEAAEDRPAELAVAFNNRGVVFDDLGDYDRAIADYEAALELRPGHETTVGNLAVAYGNRGFAHAMLGEAEAALSDYDRALELDPASALVHARRGLVRAERGEIEQARADLERARELEPDAAEVENQLAELEQRLEAAAEAQAEALPVYAATTAVNVRAGPGNQHSIQAVLQAGERVRVHGEEASWYHVELDDGSEGYVFNRYLEPAD